MVPLSAAPPSERVLASDDFYFGAGQDNLEGQLAAGTVFGQNLEADLGADFFAGIWGFENLTERSVTDVGAGRSVPRDIKHN